MRCSCQIKVSTPPPPPPPPTPPSAASYALLIIQPIQHFQNSTSLLFKHKSAKRKMLSDVSRVLFCFFIVLLIGVHEATFSLANKNSMAVKNGTALDEGAAAEEMVPVIEPGKEMVVMLNESRRKLGGFQICALCTCCGGRAKGGYCLPTPCCYAINCNIPNRPFGFCSFTPKTCNCFGCHI